MSKLQQLIQELCPDGVEWKTLGELCKISTGKLNANAMELDGKYPFFTCDATPFAINTYAFDTEAILISGNGSQVGHINYYNGKFNAYQRTYVLFEFHIEVVGYLLHFLKAYLKAYILTNCKKGSVPYITLPMLQNFQIPIPPLPVQTEIARILDKFSALTAELKAELKTRKTQYEYYRNQLLDYSEGEVEWKKLGEVAKIKNGKDWKLLKEGNIPVYGSGGIMCYVDTYAYNKPSVLIPRKGSLGNLFYIDTPFWNVDTIFYTEIDDSFILPKYLYYFLTTVGLSNMNQAGGVPSQTQNVLNRILIPIPPLAEQERIVSILDQFDTLVNSITDGLPKEIALRQKQYEYYRDLLLTFPQKTGNEI